MSVSAFGTTDSRPSQVHGRKPRDIAFRQNSHREMHRRGERRSASARVGAWRHQAVQRTADEQQGETDQCRGVGNCTQPVCCTRTKREKQVGSSERSH